MEKFNTNKKEGEIKSALNRRREKEIMSGTFLYADQGEKFYLLNIEEKAIKILFWYAHAFQVRILYERIVNNKKKNCRECKSKFLLPF